MDLTSLTGILLIAGFALVIFASIASPPRLYQESDSSVRLQIVKRHMRIWITSNVLFVVASVSTTAGLILFSTHVSGPVNAIPNWLAAGAYSLGSVAWILFLYRRTVDPAQLFESYRFSYFTAVMIGLLVFGLLLYGIVLIQAGYPGWLGYGSVGLMALIGAFALIRPARFFASFPPQIIYLLTLAAGIVMLSD